MHPLLTAAAYLTACKSLSKDVILVKASWTCKPFSMGHPQSASLTAPLKGSCPQGGGCRLSEARHGLKTVCCHVPTATSTYNLTATLWDHPIKTAAPAEPSHKSSVGTPWHTYTATEIHSFIAAIGDEQPIHKTAIPVVPGMLMLYTLCQDKAITSLSIRFFQPVYANQAIYLCTYSGRYEALCNDIRVFSALKKG